MISLDGIMCYFDIISNDLRNDNIPILNNIIQDYPGYDIVEEEHSSSDTEGSESE